MAVPLVNLFDTTETNIAGVMSAPWRAVSIRDLARGTSFRVEADGEEHGLFIMRGGGVATAPELGAVRIARGVAIALPLGGYVDLLAGDDGLQVLTITMGLADAGTHRAFTAT